MRYSSLKPRSAQGRAPICDLSRDSDLTTRREKSENDGGGRQLFAAIGGDFCLTRI